MTVLFDEVFAVFADHLSHRLIHLRKLRAVFDRIIAVGIGREGIVAAETVQTIQHLHEAVRFFIVCLFKKILNSGSLIGKFLQPTIRKDAFASFFALKKQ